MATILSLKRRIKAASNVSKTTRAMQMIAASKMKKAQNSALSVKPYAEKIGLLSTKVREKIEKEALHPYMEERNESGKTLFLVFSPDKGLCGGLITNLLSEVIKNIKEDDLVITVGKKIENYIVRLNKTLIASYPFGNTLPIYETVYSIAKMVDDNYLNKKVDNVKIIYTNFASIFSQKPIVLNLLPIAINVNENEQNESDKKNPFQLFEPSIEELLPTLIKKYFEITVYQKLLESYLSEQASRMVAMQNATTNARDIILDLTLEYNKTRQAKITSEILDITSAGFNTAYE